MHTGVNVHSCARRHTHAAAEACTCVDIHVRKHKCVFMYTGTHVRTIPCTHKHKMCTHVDMHVHT